jgi:ribosomal protein L23
MELALQQGRDVVLIEVLYLFKALVEKGQGYEKAIEAASQAIKSDVWSNSLELFKVLVEKISSLIGPKYKQRIADVSRGIASDSHEAQVQAINLLKEIVKEWKQSSSAPK